MPDDQEHIKNVLENAEIYQRLFVQPMIDAVRAEMQQHLIPIQQKVDDHDNRLGTTERGIAGLQANQKKAMAVWGILSLALASAISAGWNWLRTRFHINVG